ncbi:MAG: motility protein A [Planctomycetes bacterium]|nr:motility protein A [Planctomycetota bacterium]
MRTLAARTGGSDKHMDRGTFLGVILGFAIVMISIAAGGELLPFLHLPSLLLVLGGATAAVVVNFPLPRVFEMTRVVRKSFLYPLPDHRTEVERLVRFAQVARREGLLALEEHLEQVDDPFLVKGIRLVVDGFPAETVRDIMIVEMEHQRLRHAEGKRVIEAYATYCPAFGMVGTLIGLVHMLRVLQNPNQIGSGMAMALITTLYGALLANLVFLPIAGKLEARNREEMFLREIMLEGILAIQAGDKPLVIREKLKSFIAPAEREPLEAAWQR